VDDPKFIVYVWLEKPSTSPWGSVVAAPVFSEVVQRLVVLLDLPPDEIRAALSGN
jgi:cell division protein FtsI (penicillin-binding protein 3)